MTRTFRATVELVLTDQLDPATGGGPVCAVVEFTPESVVVRRCAQSEGQADALLEGPYETLRAGPAAQRSLAEVRLNCRTVGSVAALTLIEAQACQPGWLFHLDRCIADGVSARDGPPFALANLA